MKTQSTSNVSLAEIVAARARLNGVIARTPCGESAALSELTGANIFCKQEYLQRTGSFKERGARNALAQLTPEQARQGVITASAGNHALGLAWHGRLLGIPVTVVMPRFAPLVKIARCQQFGATVVLNGDTFDEARIEAGRLSAQRQLTYIHPFDDLRVIAGQGTLAFEILEQVPDAEAILVPVGGGGLLAGVATVLQALKPSIADHRRRARECRMFHRGAGGRSAGASFNPLHTRGWTGCGRGGPTHAGHSRSIGSSDGES